MARQIAFAGVDSTGAYRQLRVNANGELIVVGSVGGGSGAVQIGDGTNTAGLTNVAGKQSLNVAVTDIVIDHSNDSIRIGDGVNFVTFTVRGGKLAMDTAIVGDVQTKSAPEKTVVDEADANTTYVGTAPAGTALGSSLWRIKRISVSGSVTTIAFPNGDDSYSFSWTSRATYSYS